LAKACLDRIDELNERVKAFITVCPDQALEAAKRAEAEILSGHYRGPLHGIPISLKDIIATQGIRTTAGSKILADWVPENDAAIVSKLKAAGAIILGKANLHEFAYGPTGVNPHYGTALNPWDEDRIPGGSSSGSGVSVARSFCPASIGSDSGGSVRIPAALLGIVGLKPTYGLVSRRGVLPLAWSLDHLGPLTKTVTDAALILQEIAGHDPQDPASSSRPIVNYTAALNRKVKGMKIGVLQEYLDQPMEPAVKEAFNTSIHRLEGLGVIVDEVSLPRIRYASPVSFLTMASEAMAAHRAYMRERAQDYGEDIRLRLGSGQFILATQYIQAQRVRRLLYQDMQAALEKVDLLLTPTLPITAPRIGDSSVQLGDKSFSVRMLLTQLTRAFNVTGHPALSLPCGLSPSGLPIGIQLVGAPFQEETLLRLGHAFEMAFPFPCPPCSFRAGS
jgi:aspartyl-tRNA(Asn)/glutamyl-tRNA(Gln) amidotransferase subunit A